MVIGCNLEPFPPASIIPFIIVFLWAE